MALLLGIGPDPEQETVRKGDESTSSFLVYFVLETAICTYLYSGVSTTLAAFDTGGGWRPCAVIYSNDDYC
jgi:hypothetical protein